MADTNQFVVGETVRRLIAEVLELPVGNVMDSALLAEDLNASSMDLVAVALALDDEFDLEIDLSGLPQSEVSVGQIVDYVVAQRG